MKEQIAVVFDDLNNSPKTLTQLLKLLEKIIMYYGDNDIDSLIRLVQALLTYFYLIQTGIIQKAEEGEENEN